MTHDDPKLTAYALNELDDADRAQVEAFLAHDETARRIVEETRQTAGLIARGLQSVQPVALTPQQRESITAASAKRTLSYQPTTSRFHSTWARWSLAAAACAALAAGGFVLLHGTPPKNVASTNVQWTAASQPESAAGGPGKASGGNPGPQTYEYGVKSESMVTGKATKDALSLGY